MAKRICVTAGHGAGDPGVVVGKLIEAQLALDLRDRVARLLKDRGLEVVTDGAPGVNLSLVEAIKLARTTNGPKVEFHFNSGAPTACGVEALARESEKLLAQDLAYATASATGSVLRGERGWKAENSGQHTRLGFCEAGGVVLEVCFLTNAAETGCYLAARDQVAVKIADVLEKYAA